MHRSSCLFIRVVAAGPRSTIYLVAVAMLEFAFRWRPHSPAGVKKMSIVLICLFPNGTIFQTSIPRDGPEKICRKTMGKNLLI